MAESYLGDIAVVNKTLHEALDVIARFEPFVQCASMLLGDACCDCIRLLKDHEGILESSDGVKLSVFQIAKRIDGAIFLVGVVPDSTMQKLRKVLIHIHEFAGNAVRLAGTSTEVSEFEHAAALWKAAT